MSVLRIALLGIAGAAILCGAVALLAGLYPSSLVFGFWGTVLALVMIVERVTYKKTLAAPPGPGWERTTERFIDEESGKPLTVYIEPATGERQYVEE